MLDAHTKLCNRDYLLTWTDINDRCNFRDTTRDHKSENFHWMTQSRETTLFILFAVTFRVQYVYTKIKFTRWNVDSFLLTYFDMRSELSRHCVSGYRGSFRARYHAKLDLTLLPDIKYRWQKVMAYFSFYLRKKHTRAHAKINIEQSLVCERVLSYFFFFFI